MSASDSNSSPSITVTMIPHHNGTGSFTDADSRSDIIPTTVVNDHRGCIFMTNPCVEIFKTVVALRMTSRLIHETDTAPHVPIAHIVKNSCFGSGGTLNCNSGVPDVMNDVVHYITINIIN